MSRSVPAALALVGTLLTVGQASASDVASGISSLDWRPVQVAATPPEDRLNEFTYVAALRASSKGSAPFTTYCVDFVQSISLGQPCLNYPADASAATGFTSPWLNELSGADQRYKLMAFASPIDENQATTVPEPSTYVLMAAGLLGIGFIARRRTTQQER